MNKKLINIIIILAVSIFTLSVNNFLGLALILGGILYITYRNLPTIFMIIGNKKYINKNIDEAMPWYNKSYKFKHAKPMVIINYAYIILKQGNIEKSEDILRNLLKKELSDTDRTNAIINLSLILWKKECLDEAISLLEEIYHNGHKTTLVYQNLGFYYILKGDLDKALNFNLEAYDYSDSDPSILDNLAMNYYLMNYNDKAINIYEKIIPMNPAFVTTYYYYGLTLEKKEKYKEALEMLKKTLNYRFSFLSAVSREAVEKEIKALNQKLFI